jgi:hypothetical protein
LKEEKGTTCIHANANLRYVYYSKYEKGRSMRAGNTNSHGEMKENFWYVKKRRVCRTLMSLTEEGIERLE